VDLNVAHILAHKGSAVFDVPSEAPLHRAVALMAEHNVGALVVRGDDGTGTSGLVGMVSERDVVRRLHNEGPDVLAQAVSAVMSAPVITCAASDTYEAALEQMDRAGIRHLPVVEAGQVLGVLSVRDLVRCRAEDLAHERDLLTAYVMA
jgi:CBS domain-containing protein